MFIGYRVPFLHMEHPEHFETFSLSEVSVFNINSYIEPKLK